MKPRSECRVCGGRLEVIKDFGKLPMMGVFPLDGESAPKYPMALGACTKCHLLQLMHTVDPALTFTEGFGYRSATNESMVAHLRRVAKELEGLAGEGPYLDIACNDNTFLRNFLGKGRLLVGIDPVAEEVEGIETVKGFFSREAWGDRPKAKLITAMAVLYDLDDPVKFMRDIAEVLDDEGYLYVEVGSGTGLLRGTYDVMCHEHLTFFGLHHLEMLGAMAGLHMVKVAENAVNGGSFGVTFRKSPGGTGVERALERDRPQWEWLNLVGLYARIERWKAELKNVVGSLKGPVYALAASTKGNFTLHVGGIALYVGAAVDRGLHKVGRQIPGTRIPIIGEEEFLGRDPKEAVALAWHFLPSFVGRYPKLFREGKVVLPLPQPRLYSPTLL